MRRPTMFRSARFASLTGIASTLVVLGAIVACSSAPPGQDNFGDGSGGGDGTGDNGSSGCAASSGGDGNFGSSGGNSSGGTTPGPVSGASGAVDVTPACDTGLAVDDPNAASFAKAIGICTTVAAQGFGLVSASYSRAFGSTA